MDWALTGVPGGIPARSVTPYVTFTTSDYSASAINTAITNCSNAGGGVVALAAGTYSLAGVNVTKDNVTLRGAGLGSTIVQASGNGTVFWLGSGGTNVLSYPITGGGVRGTSSVTVSSTTGLSVGQMIELSRDDDADDVYTLNGAVRTSVQVNVITAIDGLTITLRNPLFIDYTTGNPTIYLSWYLQTTYSGIEDLTIDLSTGSGFAGIYMSACDKCWIKNVETSTASAYHILITATVNCEVRQVYVHESQSYGPNHAGLLIAGYGQYGANSHLRVEDSMFDKLFPAIELQNNSSGGFFGYNYFHGSQSSGTPGGVTWTMMDNHGPHNRLNLWEGNIGEMFGADGYFGSSSHATALRNYFRGSNPHGGTGNPVILNRLSYKYSLIGNVIGSSTLNPTKYEEDVDGFSVATAVYRLGYPNMGNQSWDDGGQIPGMTYPEAKVKNTLLRWGNYDYYHNAARWESSEIPADATVPTQQTVLASYVYNNKPTWFGDVAWPPIGPDVTGAAGDSAGHVHKIPAQVRFEAL